MISRIRTSVSGHGHLVKGTGALALTMSIQSGSAFLFWVAATHIASVDQVGIATSMVASVTFVTYATGFGISFALARFAPDDSTTSRSYFAFGAMFSASTSFLGSIVYLVFATMVWSSEGVLALAIFVGMTATVALNALVDTRLLALRRRRLVLARATIVASSRIALIAVAYLIEMDRGVAIFVVMLLPEAVTGFAGAVFLARGSGLLRRGVRSNGLEPRRFGRLAMVGYVGQLGIQAPTFAMPVVALWVLDVDGYGAFYLAWAIVNLILFLPQATMWSLHIEAGRSDEAFHRQVRMALFLAIIATSIATLVSTVAAPLVPLVFGRDYASAATVLPWLVLGTIPWSIVMVISVEIRLVGRSWVAASIAGIDVVGALALAAILGRSHGLAGIAVGWCSGAALTSLAMLLIRRVSHRDDRRLIHHGS